MATIPPQSATSPEAQPAWDVALLFPRQGEWTESEYLGLDTNRLVELVDGNLEVLPMPTFAHQLIVMFLTQRLRDYVLPRKMGAAVFAPMPVRIRAKTFREPDVLLVPPGTSKPLDRNVQFAQLVMEVVSADDKSHKRDYQDKRRDYAELGVPEYLIVDPQTERITVLALEGNQYRVHGEFAPGQQAISALLPEFTVDVAAAFAAGQSA